MNRPGYHREYYQANKVRLRVQKREHSRRYRAANKEKVKESTREYRKRNPDKVAEWAKRRIKYFQEYRKATKQHRVKYLNEWREANRKHVNKQAQRYRKKDGYREKHLEYKRGYYIRKKDNIEFRILRRLRDRVWKAMRRRPKHGRTIATLGCSMEDFLIYLESKFEPGMSLENYGKVWHIDHIMPCAIFDLAKPEHQKRCFHFSNLQPMFAHKNLKKHAKVITNQFNLL
jgi:hypothetical protein